MKLEKILFDKVVMNGLQLKNRAVVAPMSRVSTEGDGVPTKIMREYYQRYAEGDFALIVTEGCYTDRLYSQAYPNQPGMTNEQQQTGWESVVRAVHKAGGKIVLQLMHAGALSQHLSNTRAPSSIQPMRNMLAGYSNRQGHFPMPQAMNLAEIDNTIAGFVEAAVRAERAGFNGVEIHGANGYLLDQFLTEYTNDREDHYGGSMKNRCRLSTEIIKAIKNTVSASFVVGIRLSQGKVNDFDYAWPNGSEDAKVIFSSMQNAGADYIHFASEGKGFEHGCITRDGSSLPKLARDLTSLPVIANGGLDNVEKAKYILETGQADLIALGAGALANPDWPMKIRKGRKVALFEPVMFAKGVDIRSQLEWEENRVDRC